VEREPACGPADLTVRRARAGDRAAILAIMERTYGAFNPFWDEVDGWLADTVGELYVAETAGRVAGFGKLTRLGAEEWWAEGMQVAPEFRAQGVGTRMAAYRTELFRRIGSGTLRSMVAGYNEHFLRVCEALGQRRIVTYAHMTAAPSAGEPVAPSVVREVDALRPLAPSDVGWAFALAAGSRIFEAARGLVERRWKWHTLTPALLTRLAATGEAFAWGDRRGVACLVRRDAPGTAGGRETRVGFASSTAPDDMGGLSRAIRQLDPAATVHFRVPDEADLLRGLEGAGYLRRTSFESTFHVLELRASGNAGPR
jgi:GNAT superfamily N-acetyltransferase